MSAIISHTRCQKCQKIFKVDDLYDNSDDIGKICIDFIECQERKKENTEISNPARKPTR